MNLNRLTRDADDLIRKVVSRYNQLYVPAGTISQVELDLILDDLRKLYDTFKTIGQVNLSMQSSVSKPEVSVSNAFRADHQQASPANPANIEKTTLDSEPSPEPQEPEPLSEPDVEIEQETEPETVLTIEKKEEAVIESEPEVEPYSETPFVQATEKDEFINPVHSPEEETTSAFNPESLPTTLADRFSSGNKSLSETMGSVSSQGGLGSRLLYQPITDLSSGIGLNDKFSFISELFSNDQAQYDEAITRINKAVNVDEANWILQKYHAADWDQKQETLTRLKEFVKRRFI